MTQRSRKDILKQLAAGEITSAQAFDLIQKPGGQTAQVLHAQAEAPAPLYFQSVWEPCELPDTRLEPLPGDLLLFGSDIGWSRSVRLAEGRHLVQVRPGKNFQELGDLSFTINPERLEDYNRLTKALERLRLLPDFVVHAGIQEPFRTGEAQVTAQLQKGVFSLFCLIRALMKHPTGRSVQMLYLASESEQSVQPLDAAVAAFAKSLALENPKWICKTLASSLPTTAWTDRILQELQAGPDQVEICYRDNKRYVKTLRELDEPTSADLPLKEQGVYLLTGGAGGLGLIFAEYLARKVHARLVLTGRSPLNDKIKQQLHHLETLGAQAVYMQADVSRKQDVAALVERTRSRFAGLNGVLHCAGVLRDSLLMKKTKQDMDAVFAPKVYGTIFLDEATQNDPLDFFVLFSSTAGVIGNAGQCDYAFGNSFLDHYAQWRSANGRPGKSLSFNWPLWEEGGMHATQAAVDAMRQMAGLTPLRKETGLAAFEKGLQSAATQWLVLEGYPGEIRRAMQREATPAAQPVNAGDTLDPSLQAKAEGLLKDLLSQAIRVPAAKIDAQESLERFGLDSVLSMKLTRELEQHFGSLPKTIFYEYLTIADLARYFVTRHQAKLVALTGHSPQPQPKAEQPAPPASAAGVGRNRFAAAATVSAPRPAPMPARPEDDIAIIGVAGRYPMARNLDQFWENLNAGRDCITEIPTARWDVSRYFDTDRERLGTSYCKWGGFIDDVDKFDPLCFNISPREAEFMDPQERLFLETVWETMEDAGYNRRRVGQSPVGVFVGVMYGHYELHGLEGMNQGAHPAVGSSFSAIANRVSYHFNFHGPSLALDTMCSSSLVAVHLACDSIRRGECDMAVAGGVNVSIHPLKYVLLSQTTLAASEGHCRSFGEGGDGYVPGEGVGAILLKPVQKAIADGDRIYAVIKASAVNHNGKTNGYMVPNPNAQAEVIVKALTKAHIDPRTISYIEAQATGSAMGDVIEARGLMKAYQEFTQAKQYCPVGSVKSNIGHLESAAGMAAIAKVLLQMKHKQLVPSLHSAKLNPDIPFGDSAFYVQQDLRDWRRPVLEVDGVKHTYPLRAGISAFGAGGTNVHLVLEEYEPASPAGVPSSDPQVIVLSARNEEQLRKQAANLLQYLEQGGLFQPQAELQTHLLLEQLRRDLTRFAAELLGIQEQDVDPDEDWSECGFDALNLSKLAELVNQAFGLDINPAVLSEQRSLRMFAGHLLDRHSQALVKRYSREYQFQPDSPASSGHRLAEIAYTLQMGREAMEERLAIVAANTQELGQALTAYCAGRTDAEGVFTGNAEGGNAEPSHVGQEVVQGLVKQKHYADLAQRWVNGADINWQLLYLQYRPAVVSLPTYPFARERYWIAVPTSQASVPPLRHLLTAPVEAEAGRQNGGMEGYVKRLVAGLLKLPEAQIKMGENLGKYGFDSLSGMKMISTLEKACGQKIPVQAIMEFSSIQEIARYLTENNFTVPEQKQPDTVPKPPEGGGDFRQRFSAFLLSEVKEGRLTPKRAVELEAVAASAQERTPAASR